MPSPETPIQQFLKVNITILKVKLLLGSCFRYMSWLLQHRALLHRDSTSIYVIIVVYPIAFLSRMPSDQGRAWWRPRLHRFNLKDRWSDTAAVKRVEVWSWKWLVWLWADNSQRYIHDKGKGDKYLVTQSRSQKPWEPSLGPWQY